MEDIRLGDLNLSSEESKSIIEFLTKKRKINNYKLSRAMNCCAL